MSDYSPGMDHVQVRNRAYLWGGYLTITVVAILVVAAMLWIYGTGRYVAQVHGRLADATMEIQLEATTGHLWFEEAITGDRAIDVNSVLDRIDQARSYAVAMLDGGDTPKGTFPPLSDEVLRESIVDVIGKIDRFRELTELRWSQRETAGIGSEIDQEYDTVFAGFLQQANEVEAALRKAIDRDMRAFRTLHTVLIGAVLGIMGVAGVLFGRSFRRQVHDAAELTAANQHLDAINQQLRATQQELEASNRQLMAGEQQLRAANQQLTASDQQLRAANQQLNASSQQLRAANQQLEATNQQLRASQQELSHQYQFLHDVFESLNHPLYVINPANYMIEAANSASGVRGGDAVTCHKLSHGLDHPCSQNGEACPIQEVCEKGEPVTVEHTHYDDRGMPHFTEIHAYPVMDDNGSVARVIESVRDITKRKLAQRKVEDLARFPSENPNPVLRIDASGTIAYGNSASKALLDCWGTQVNRTVPKDFLRVAGECLKDGQVRDMEVECASRVLSLTLAPVQESGYTNVYGLDITPRLKAQEEARKAMADIEHMSRLITVGELASGLAHELNQPLCAILNYANTGLRTIKAGSEKPERVNQALEQIAFQADRAGEIIRRMRNLIGKHEIVRSRLNINDVVREVLTLLKSETRARRVRIVTELADDLPFVQADDVQLGQVILNFLRNAFDAVKGNPAADRVVKIRTAHEAGRVVLQVEDNGVGLSPEQKDRVFESFYTTKKEGLGIGLSLSRSIIEAHSGHIEAEPNSDQGAVFSFALPISDDLSPSVCH